MRRAFAVCALYVEGLAAMVTGCGSSATDCTCSVRVGSEPRALACGETACINGTSVSCIRKDESVQRGACTTPPPSSPPDAGAMPPDFEPDRRCDELLTFCNVGCQAPASAAAECQATASTGDANACDTFRFTRGITCRP
jgi:hypothetical protein